MLDEIKKITDKISKLEKTNKNLKNELHSKDDLEKITDKISKLEKTNKNLKNELHSKDDIEKITDKISKLENQYKDENSQIKIQNSMLNNENLGLKEEIRKYKNLIIQKDNKIKEYTNYKKDYSKLDKSKKKLESETENLKNKIKDLKKQIKDFTHQIKVLNEYKRPDQVKKDMEKLQEKLNESMKTERKLENLKNLKEGLNFESKEHPSVIIEHYQKLSQDIEDLSIQKFTQLKELPQKVKKYRWTINGKPFNEKHPKWEKYKNILNEFNTVLHNKNKIENLIKNLGWKLKNEKNHKVYTRLNYRFVSPSTPSEWATTFFKLEKIEKEIIENDN